MNREEAILWFEQMLYYLADDEWNKDARAAVSVALDALCSPWVKTADRLPTKNDARGGKLAVIDVDGRMSLQYWKTPVQYPKLYIWWMPIPPLPEVERK